MERLMAVEGSAQTDMERQMQEDTGSLVCRPIKSAFRFLLC